MFQVEHYREMKEAAAAEAQRLHEEQLRTAQEAVRQLIEQNRPRVEKREQLLQEKEDRRRLKEVCIHVCQLYVQCSRHFSVVCRTIRWNKKWKKCGGLSCSTNLQHRLVSKRGTA
jgi:uncharacterized membrane protein YccC